MPISRNRKSVSLNSRKYNLRNIPARYFNRGELEYLLTLIESVNAETVIEFGVNNGRTPLAVFKNVTTIKHYVGIDVESDYKTQMPVQRNEVPSIPGELALHDPRFQLIIKPRGSFDLTPADLPMADVAFIDADHSRRGVENDTTLARAVVRPGGLIIWHDDNCLPAVEVTQTLNDFVDAGADIKHIAKTWLSFEVNQVMP